MGSRARGLAGIKQMNDKKVRMGMWSPRSVLTRCQNLMAAQGQELQDVQMAHVCVCYRSEAPTHHRFFHNVSAPAHCHTQVTEQLSVFKANLESFASFADAGWNSTCLQCHRKYKKDITKIPELRRDFHRMCANIGVDPLACTYVAWRGDDCA